MERGLGGRLDDVRLHTGAQSAWLLGGRSASGGTWGRHVALSPNAPPLSGIAGEALLAHELAHVLQQQGHPSATPDPRAELHGPDTVAPVPDADLERDADDGARDVLLGRNSGRTRRSSGLRLALTSCAPLPEMRTVEERAAWIRRAVESGESGTGRDITRIFALAASQQEFDRLQRLVPMDRVVAALDDWQLVYLGTLGPLRAGLERLNAQRAAHIADLTHDWDVARGEVITLLIFNTATDDDVTAVMQRLAAARQMANTISRMPTVQAMLRARGIDPARYQDPSAPLANLGRGVASGLGRIVDTIPIVDSARGQQYQNVKEQLPEPYRNQLDAIDMAAINHLLSPSNVALGAADYVTFGVVGSAAGLVTGTVRGVRDLAAGNTEAAGEELTGALVAVLSFVGVRAFRAARGAAIRRGIRLPGFPEPLTEAQALIGETLPLDPDGAAAGGALLDRLGRQGVLDVGGYLRARRAAALFVAEGGAPAAEALAVARGDVARARAALAARSAQVAPARAPGGVSGPGGAAAATAADPNYAPSARESLWIAGLGPAALTRLLTIFTEAGLPESAAAALPAAEANSLLAVDADLAAGRLAAADVALEAIAELPAADRARLGSALSRLNRQPDLATVRRVGNVSGTNNQRATETPYRTPPDMIRVGPGRPLNLTDLPREPLTSDPNAYLGGAVQRGPTYLWVVDEDGVVRVARERQPGYTYSSGSRAGSPRPLKHGDLTPSAGDATTQPGQRRGSARLGGELYWSVDRQGHAGWTMDNNSSYAFGLQRTDFTATTAANLAAARELLGQAGTDITAVSTWDYISAWNRVHR